MKIVCNPSEGYLKNSPADLLVLLYSQPKLKNFACAGDALQKYISRSKFELDDLAWDLVSFALAVISADFGALRKKSPDGWTRFIEVEVAVRNKALWDANRETIEQMLNFLSTDIWRFSFSADGFCKEKPKKPKAIDGTCISLISGGLDSLVGAIDLVSNAEKPLFISQIVHGDKEKQSDFVETFDLNFEHLQITHGFRSPNDREPSQRARSIVFLTFGVLGATLLKKYKEGSEITLYVCENGLISINPPLTEARIGSLSTRTTHPHFLNLYRKLIHDLGFRVRIINPYQLKTKGEMLAECKDQELLRKAARKSTSCSRFTRNNFQHCGRCIPCLIRRSSFIKWKTIDRTGYLHKNIGLKDDQHARFDDVRSAAMAVLDIEKRGFEKWFGSSLSMLPIEDTRAFREVAKRGMAELKILLEKYHVC